MDKKEKKELQEISDLIQEELTIPILKFVMHKNEKNPFKSWELQIFVVQIIAGLSIGFDKPEDFLNAVLEILSEMEEKHSINDLKKAIYND